MAVVVESRRRIYSERNIRKGNWNCQVRTLPMARRHISSVRIAQHVTETFYFGIWILIFGGFDDKERPMGRLINILDPEWWRFEWRYWRGKTPWDTQITPPEVMDFLHNAAPGHALDLGCGTGTNAITLAQNGWKVTGVDFSPKAIAAARKKAAHKQLDIKFYLGDVAELGGFAGPFDYALDIGCLFSLKPEDRQKYANGLIRLLSPGACYMLYAWLPQIWRGRRRGISVEEVHRLFLPAFGLDNMIVGHDGGGDSAWYWFTRQ